VIVSASYRTDIPAFYGRWFLRRLDAGFCRTSNPYNRRVSTVSLLPEDVDGFVFWTKNLGPFLEPLSTIRTRGYPFVVQYTITGYPRELEQAVIPWQRSCDQAAETASRFGRRVVVWRYDPILTTSLTPVSFHVDRFAAIAERLTGVVDEVVVSWTQMYKKTTANLNKTGLEWSDPSDADKRDLVTRLAAEASRHRIALTVCSQSAYASAPGAQPAKCIDAARLGDVRGEPLAAKTLGNRPDCECHESRDIGEYDTCPHGCVYCYAVRNQGVARDRHRDHDSESDFLFDPRSSVG
jgi:Domain of unknown function (DUF1848)